MSYRDPYAGHRYNASEDYNPYSGTAQPHPTYEQGGYETYGNYGAEGYRDEPFDPNAQATHQHTYSGAPVPPPKDEDQRSGFDRDEFTNEKPRKRYGDTDGSMWTKGGRGRCVGRFCCCTLMTAVFLILSILLALALWVRPPNVVVGDLDTTSGSGGSVVQFSSDGLKINLAVNISVTNPNYFSVALNNVKATLKYPINGEKEDVGGGTLDDVDFPSHSTKDIKFPFSIDYKLTDDPNYTILKDLASKCGLGGSTSDITVDYTIKIGVRFLFINVSPSISNSYSFACPIDTSNSGDLEELLKAAGIDINDLGGLLDGSS
ncbi:uncharacterized protein SCHCODRAFT_02605677 [Schizophyllum commune H4-8]|uniref:uncharacterized protein n=1 Tax=Schizophyllum commune (strain H4-8 / FGSC 9210) TaxID=578458 RepID=UPI00215EE35C|nr:uncharacterized protein SCHCODRAFT_02605677 [Schizophyllum commune H4-8]KAI5899627.1 hypothetical protein SCHCODRAFT_02605677 [Schizophyllum commune H4-8]